MDTITNISEYSFSIPTRPSLSEFYERVETIKNLVSGENLHNKYTVTENFFTSGSPSIFQYIQDEYEDQIASGELFRKLYDGPIPSKEEPDYNVADAIHNLNNQNFIPNNYHLAMKTILDWPIDDSSLHISTIEDIYKIHIKNLINYPVSPESYISRSSYIFNNLAFHEELLNELKKMDGGICNFSKGITKSLAVLNNLSISPNTQENLTTIAQESGYECTPQGSDKKQLKYEFGDYNLNVNCEFHLKIHRHNNPGITTHYHNRIYFGFHDTPNGKKVFVGHIGGHL